MRADAATLGCAAVFLSGCGAPSVATPEVRASVECRGFRDPAPRVFDAALETLFDTGYIVCLCDRRTGIAAGHDPRDYRLGWQTPQISVFVDGGRELVRVTPGRVGGHTPTDAQIGEFFGLMGQRVALEPWTGGMGGAR